MKRELIHPLTGEAVVVRLDYLPTTVQLPDYLPVRPRTAVARPRLKAPNPLLDIRTTAELWLAGESPEPGNRAYGRARRGEYRRVRVQFADGTERITGSYLADDAEALAWCTRFARAMAMTAKMTGGKPWDPRCAGRGTDVVVAIYGKPTLPDANGWSKLRRGGYTVRTAVCDLPAVISAEFTEDFTEQHVVFSTHAEQLESQLWTENAA